MKDPFTPLNYRGISLLSCVSKLYSRVINNKLTAYCNICDILVDDQNGFRKDRSCLDHIFSLSSILTKDWFLSKQYTNIIGISSLVGIHRYFQARWL